MMDDACEVCGASLMNGVTLYRQTPPGVMPTSWRCRAHNAQPLDDETQRLVDAIEEGRDAPGAT